MKKFLTTLLIIFTCFTITARPVAAAFPAFLPDFSKEIRNAVATNLGKFSVESIFRSAGTLLYALIGDFLYFFECDGMLDYNNSPDSYYGGGMIPGMVQYTAQLMNRPIKSSEYVADVLHNTGIVKQAYAQGMGFSGLTPILQIWKGFRNLTYFIFILIFVVIGFMIMFRKKMGSNTIITIQEALPRIIVTLLLITFSYAIAGFVIDLMYLSIMIMMGLLEQAGVIVNAKVAINTLFDRNIIGIGLSYFTGFTEPAGQAAEAMGQLVSQAVGGALGLATNVVFYLFFAIAVLIAVVKTFVQLVIAYVGIILSTIFAPLQLVGNAFPGNDSFKKWFQGLIANAAVFPVACGMIVIGAAIGGKSVILPTDKCAGENGLAVVTQPENVGFEYKGFIPPLIYSGGMSDWNNNTPGFGNKSGGSVNAAKALIGFGIIMMLPEVVKITKKTLEVKDEDYGGMAVKNAQSGDLLSGPLKMVGSTAFSGLSQSFWSSQYANFVAAQAKKRAQAALTAKQANLTTQAKYGRYLTKPVKTGTGATQAVGAAPSAVANQTQVVPPSAPPQSTK